MVPPASHQVSRVPRYSGYWPVSSPFAYGTLTLYGWAFQLLILLDSQNHYASPNPKRYCYPLVWPLPRSLATTYGISIDFFSCGYLDVSVPNVSLVHLCIHVRYLGINPRWVSPFGHLRINGYLRLPVAFRSLSRPSSAPGAKAFTLCS